MRSRVCPKNFVQRSTANVFYITEVGSAVSGTTFFGGWYIVPGYGYSATPASNRWGNGSRHTLGRNWNFCDGHAKFTHDDGATASILDYQHKGIYTYPQTDGPDYVSPY